MGLVSRLRRRLSHLANWAIGSERVSYAQCGEDLIVDYVLAVLDVGKVSYLDIGAHHPRYLSNTYYFYRQGGRGVCVEPDPSAQRAFKQVRPRDLCLPVGIGNAPGTADLFLMTTSTLNTFSREEAERYQAYGTEQIERVIPVEIKTVNQVLGEYFESVPDFVSIDVEGMDLSILKDFDFERFRPKVFCVETLTYTEDGGEEKISELQSILQQNDYLIYADTYVNTIAVDRHAWTHRKLLRACKRVSTKA
jgi:FkbM family methyltransferase